MIFNKPANISYTDMAIYIDKHIYKENCDDYKCYQYMFHLYEVLAFKKCLFKTGKDYEDFAIYAAGQLFKRYRNPKQDKGQLPRIKSCLNYIKTTLYPLKVNYQQGIYAERFQEESLTSKGLQNLKNELEVKASNMNNDFLQIDVEHYLNSITSTIKHFLKFTPYCNDKVTFHNLYISILLSLLKKITLSNEHKKKLENKAQRISPVTSEVIEEIYQEEALDSVILFHLDPSMYNYVDTLVNRVKKEIAQDMLYLIGYYKPSSNVIHGILTSSMQSSKRDNND